jgi:hypothetical protein
MIAEMLLASTLWIAWTYRARWHISALRRNSAATSGIVRSSFVTEPQLPARSLEPLDHLAHNVGSTGKNALLSNLARPTFIRHGNGDRRLVHIKSNVGDTIHLVRLP